MRTDRELLEMAAKAAGIEHAMCYDAYPEDGFPTAYAKIGKNKFWNPLTDDGDALRLEVVLRLSIHQSQRGKFVSAHNPVVECTEEMSSAVDQFAATRRAIVRAAAEIGAQMKEVPHEGS